MVAVDRDPERVSRVEEGRGEFVLGVVADVTDGAANERAVEKGLDRFGRLDVFVGNAGIFDYGAALMRTPMAALDNSFDEVFAINVKAPLLGIKAASEALAESSGSVTLTASMGSWHAGVGGVVYTASKHAVVGLVRQLAFELAAGVRVAQRRGARVHENLHPRTQGTRLGGHRPLRRAGSGSGADCSGHQSARFPSDSRRLHGALRALGLPIERSHHYRRGGRM